MEYGNYLSSNMKNKHGKVIKPKQKESEKHPSLLQ